MQKNKNGIFKRIKKSDKLPPVKLEIMMETPVIPPSINEFGMRNPSSPRA